VKLSDLHAKLLNFKAVVYETSILHSNNHIAFVACFRNCRFSLRRKIANTFLNSPIYSKLRLHRNTTCMLEHRKLDWAIPCKCQPCHEKI